MTPYLISNIKTRFQTLVEVNSAIQPDVLSRVLCRVILIPATDSVWSYIFKLDQIE